MTWTVAARYVLPLKSTTGVAQDFLRPGGLTEILAQTRQFAVIKPQRQLGAPWMDNFVSRRQNVALCEECWRRYGDWWKRMQYRGDWVGWITDCDGCSRETRCSMFYPEETIREVLHPRFWEY